ncbi:MAG: alanine--tRNA ligase [Alphaproteobacteria bacterium]|nr:MAG: alanine--tRNA ligase [Alphaproteobacteria bacterium]
MKTLTDIRAAFLGFYGKNGHTVVPSSPLVPRNDPSMMFTNSGMVQFKNVFTGAEQRPYTRATSAQKCVRAGGKHNDLDNVGYTARHHTFFEMLGNFSFGDYFKETAIDLAWGLVTKELGLPADKLCVTVYHDDDQAFGHWRKISGLPEERIIRISTDDNFWRMGDTGPCGPCSEIFYDHGPAIAGGPPGSPDADGDRFIEIWNLVFMQYEQVTPEKRVSLPKPSIDTGMGLERMAAVLQGVHSNYETDLLQALIHACADLTGVAPEGPHSASHRVIADHLRAISFLIADGVLPSNDGRGYVLRRILRRAARHAHLLGAREPVLHRLVPELSRQMGAAYPELIRAEALITETLKLEEARFRQTLERGLKLLEEETGRLKPGGSLPGEVAFKLYDTYGFPLDLTQDVLRGQEMSVDTAGFDSAMARQRELARQAWSGSGETKTDRIWFDLKEELGASEFLGYSTQRAEGIVQAMLQNGQRVQEAKAGDEVSIIVNQTPFYGESGGQVGDSGIIRVLADGGVTKAEIRIEDTQKPLGALIVHKGRIASGAIKIGDTVLMIVDDERRASIRAHHSATHLLHAALRRHLGAHVTQKGSLVAADRLRFDFSHPSAVTREQMTAIEDEVNNRILANEEAVTRLMTPDEAITQGAMALFGEKYGEEVRVVSMGGAFEDCANYSVELCGGTHVRRTGDIGLFKIVRESSVSAGIRRIEAVTAQAARRWYEERNAWLESAASHIKTTPAELGGRLEALTAEIKSLQQQLGQARRQALSGASSGTDSADTQSREINGVRLLTRTLQDVPAAKLRGLADDAKAQIGAGVVLVMGKEEGKISLVVAVTADLTARFNAVDLARRAAEAVGGKGGGGRPDMAQAGGPGDGDTQAAIRAVEEALKA